MSKPIICIDFDGVIHGYQSGWKGAHVVPDPPVPGAIDALLSYLDAGFDVAIFSARSKDIRGRWAMQAWLRQAIQAHWETTQYVADRTPSLVECECWSDATGIERRFKWPWFKPSAIITIDDRALTFNGDWSDAAYTPARVRGFRPWNKRLDKIDTPPPPVFSGAIMTDTKETIARALNMAACGDAEDWTDYAPEAEPVDTDQLELSL